MIMKRPEALHQSKSEECSDSFDYGTEVQVLGQKKQEYYSISTFDVSHSRI